MPLQLTLTHLITLAVFFLGILATMMFGLVRYIAHQQEKREGERLEREGERFAALTEQLEKLSAGLKDEATATLQLERQFMRFQADLPRDYVRRDDHIRAVASIEAKVDNMALRVERALSSRTTGGTP